MKLFTATHSYHEYNYRLEEDFEREVIANSKKFFGIDTIFIDVKRKIDTKGLGGSIPDGFLFDLADPLNPEFYLVEVELQKHDFFTHIFPQITKFFAFFKNRKSQSELVEKIFSTINTDQKLNAEFKKHLGGKEIYKFLIDTIQQSQNILLIIDGEKKELPEIIETYSDTWGSMVRKVILRKFTNGQESIFMMEPEFENIEFAELSESSSESNSLSEVNEEDHLSKTSENLTRVFLQLKEHICNNYPDIIFNVQKYYISIRGKKSLAFFEFRRKKIYLVVLLPENIVREKVRSHHVKTLTESVQKFWNGESCAIIIEENSHLEELYEVLALLINK